MVLVKVNQYEIGEQEFLAEVSKLCGNKGLSHPDENIINNAVKNLIEGYLVLNEALKSSIAVTEDEVEQEMIDYMMQFKDKEKYQEDLEGIKITNDQLKKHLKNRILIGKYLKAKVQHPQIPNDEQLRRFYQENIKAFKVKEVVRVSHILIKPEMGLEKAKEVRAKLKTPHDFFETVSCCSDCPSCLQAGDLGYIVKGKMVAEFDEVAFNLDLHEISQPVATKFGYHIIMLTDRKKGLTLPFEEIKDLLKKRLQDIEYELEVVRHINELREKADIFVSDEIWSFFQE